MKPKGSITILAIETSCDDTGIAIVKAEKNGSFEVKSNIVSSQTEIHKKWGGVYPALAKREHQRNLPVVFEKALKEARLLKAQNSKFKVQNYNIKIKTLDKILEREKELKKKLTLFLKKYQKPDIDLIAVTNGPGLEPCLWVGVNFAKVLAYYWNLPIVSVNHLKAHIFINTGLKKKDLPAVCLVVSGGHTLLFLMKDFGKYEVLGETRDDAAGECFDKTARILGLGYPGGSEIEKLALQFQPSTKIFNFSALAAKLPRPMINTKDYDFSFSGLKTAVLYTWQKIDKKYLPRSERQRILRGMCKEIQQAIIDVLIKKTMNAAVNKKAKTIILGGGVVANKELTEQFQERIKKLIPKTKLLFPNPENCTDNALMVAVAGHFKHRNGKTEDWKKIKVDANLKI